MTNKIEKISTIFLSLVILASVFTPIQSVMAEPTILVVDNDGTASAENCDDSSTAYTTIQSAVDAASPGDTIIVCPGTTGTYVESVLINTNGITVMSAEGENAVVVDGTGASAFVIIVNGVTLSGFEAKTGVAQNCIDANGNDIDIINNIASDCKIGINVNGNNNAKNKNININGLVFIKLLFTCSYKNHMRTFIQF